MSKFVGEENTDDQPEYEFPPFNDHIYRVARLDLAAFLRRKGFTDAPASSGETTLIRQETDGNWAKIRIYVMNDEEHYRNVYERGKIGWEVSMSAGYWIWNQNGAYLKQLQAPLFAREESIMDEIDGWWKNFAFTHPKKLPKIVTP